MLTYEAWFSMVLMPFYYDYLWWVFIGAFGLCIGSFLNVVIIRVPIDKSIVTPGSACPGCGTPIGWYDNLPILSFIVLRGKCRHCGLKISWRYPAIEALTGAITVLMFLRYGLTFQTGIYLVLAYGMIAVAVIDAEHMIIPDGLSIGGAVLGLCLSFVPGGVTPLESLIGAAGASGSLALIRWGHMKITGIEGMGLGDVKLAATIGAFLGWFPLPPTFLLSTLSGLLIAGALLIIQRKGARTPIPFGTFLAAGTVAYVFVEPWWISYLLSR